ncbi:MAG: YbaY family lipoprotein [Nitrospiria bacterium]
MTTKENPVLKGEILFEKAEAAFSKATARIYLEDVSLADASAKIVAEQVISDVNRKSGSPESIHFSLSGELHDRAHYSVRVHIDLKGDGEIHRGDYITMESYPVLTFGHPDFVRVFVKKVR